MKKLRLRSLFVLVRGTSRSPSSAERRPGRPELSATVQAMLLKWAGLAPRTQSSQCSNFDLYPLRYWQPMEDVAKDRCDVLIFTKTNNKTSGGVEHHFCSRRMTAADVPWSTVSQ